LLQQLLLLTLKVFEKRLLLLRLNRGPEARKISIIMNKNKAAAPLLRLLLRRF
jgi:hypothetical protein